MNAPRPLAAPLLILGACALFAGCGGEAADVGVLKTQLTGVADALDACVGKTNDARKCTGEPQLGSLPDGTELGKDVGQIQIQADRPLRYELVAQAGDDVQFMVVAQPVGARKRVCVPQGQGACPKGGAW